MLAFFILQLSSVELWDAPLIHSLQGLTSLTESTHIHTHTHRQSSPIQLFLQLHLLRPRLASLVALYGLEVHSPSLRFDCITSGWGLGLDRFVDVLVTPFALRTWDCALYEELLRQTCDDGASAPDWKIGKVRVFSLAPPLAYWHCVQFVCWMNKWCVWPLEKFDTCVEKGRLWVHSRRFWPRAIGH